MKKEEIYVVIDSEEKRLRAIQILSDAGENIWEGSRLLKEFTDEMIVRFNSSDNSWWTTYDKSFFIISLDQLEQMLSPKQEIKMELDALKLIAESYGFELAEKKREIKVGDFGKFWDNNSIFQSQYGFLKSISKDDFESYGNLEWSNFSHLTDEEKANIQENW